MILTIGNIKGGVGKTTLAVNLTISYALSGRDVLLVDGDEQYTAMTFTELRTNLRENPGYTAVRLQGNSLRTQVRQLTNKYDDIIIDVGGRDTGSLRAALTITDLILIPVQPRSFDIWALEQVKTLIEEAQSINDLIPLVVLNAADAQGQDNAEAANIISEIKEFTLLPITIGRRKAFSNAVAMGCSVLEHNPKDIKAIQEINSLTNLINQYYIGTTYNGNK